MCDDNSMFFSHDPYSHAPNFYEVPPATLDTAPAVPKFKGKAPNPFDIVWRHWHFNPMHKHPCLAIFGECHFGSVCQLSAMGRWVCWDCIQGKPHSLCRGLPPPAHPCERLHRGQCIYGRDCKIRDCPRSWCPHCLRGSPHKVCNGIKPYFLKPKTSNETVVVDSYEGHSFPFLPKIRAIENLKGDGPCVQDVAMQATAHHAALSSNEEEDKACLLVALLKGPYTKENGVIALLERNGGSPQGPSGALVLKKENQTKLRKT